MRRISSMSSSFAVAASMSRYATALPAVPRISGAVAVSAHVSASAGAVVCKLVPKDAVSAAVGGGAAGADASAEGGVAVVYGADGARSLVAPVAGKKAADVRKAAAAAVAKARALKLAAPLALDVSALGPGAAGAAAQAGALAAYSFSRYITGAAKAPHALAGLEVLCAAGGADAAAVAASARAVEGVVVARDCGNERADEMHPDRVEAVARAVAAESGMEVFALVGEELLAAGMHMHYSVGQGARYQPRYIELFHKGDPEHPEDIIAVVGKGITCVLAGAVRGRRRLNLPTPPDAVRDVHAPSGPRPIPPPLPRAGLTRAA